MLARATDVSDTDVRAALYRVATAGDPTTTFPGALQRAVYTGAFVRRAIDQLGVQNAGRSIDWNAVVATGLHLSPGETRDLERKTVDATPYETQLAVDQTLVEQTILEQGGAAQLELTDPLAIVNPDPVPTLVDRYAQLVESRLVLHQLDTLLTTLEDEARIGERVEVPAAVTRTLATLPVPAADAFAHRIRFAERLRQLQASASPDVSAVHGLVFSAQSVWVRRARRLRGILGEDDLLEDETVLREAPPVHVPSARRPEIAETQHLLTGEVAVVRNRTRGRPGHHFNLRSVTDAQAVATVKAYYGDRLAGTPVTPADARRVLAGLVTGPAQAAQVAALAASFAPTTPEGPAVAPARRRPTVPTAV